MACMDTPQASCRYPRIREANYHPGVTQLEECLLWEQDAGGSNPPTWTRGK